MSDLDTRVAVMENTLSSYDDRIKSLHGRVGEAQINISDHKADIKVIKRDVEETKQDFIDFKDEFGKAIGELRKDFNKKFETLTTAVRWGTGTLLAAIGLLVALLTGGGG